MNSSVPDEPAVDEPAVDEPALSSPIPAATALFAAAELGALASSESRRGSAVSDDVVACTAIGTTAGHALSGALLAEAFKAEGLDLTRFPPPEDPDALLGTPQWQLCLVLSPWKRSVAAILPRLSPSAAQSGVVDTIVRTGPAVIGYNTNTWAVQVALAQVAGPVPPERLLILGSGASARSISLAAARLWPDCTLMVSARSAKSAGELARGFDAIAVEASDAAVLGGADLVVNTTTWGETEASEQAEFPFPLGALFRPGGAFLDINNRISALQLEALRAGCRVMGGAVMQRATHACRARIARLLVSGGLA
jgi:shikimate dehydrogenase